MNYKKIAFVTHPQETHWVGDGFKVHNFIPGIPGLEMKDMSGYTTTLLTTLSEDYIKENNEHK